MSGSSKTTILLVEDEAIIAMTEKMALEKYGYVVKSVNTGEKAIEAVKTDPELKLVLMDINLGDGIDGTRAAEIILEDHDIPIVFVSSHSELEVVAKTEKITSYGYVVKSSSITVLDASIKMAFKLFNANQSIKKSEIKQKTMISNISDVIGIIDVNGIIKYKSPNIEKWFGWKPEDLEGTDGWLVVHPDDLARIQNEFHSLLKADNSSTTVEYRYRCKDGSYKPIELTAVNLRNVPSINGILINFHDITELLCTNNLLKENEERFKMLFNNAPLGYQSLDSDGNFIEVNQQWLDTFGYTRNEVIGRWFGDFLSPKFRDGFRKRFPLFKAQGYIHSEFEMMRKDGGLLYISFEGKIGHDSSGKFKQTHCILQDITDRKKNEEALRTSKESSEMLLNVAAEIIISDDFDGNIISLNESGYKMLGYESPELIGKNFFDTCLPEDVRTDVKTSLEKLRYGGEDVIFTHENDVITKTGDRKTILWHNAVMKDRYGKAIGLFSSGEDITDRKKAEIALQEKNKGYEYLNKELKAQNEKLIQSQELLRQSEERYRMQFMNVNSYNSMYEVVSDEDGKPIDFRFVMVNQAYEKYVGKKASDLIGKTLLEVYPETEQYWIDKMVEAVLTGTPRQLEAFSKEMNLHTEISLYTPQKGYLVMTTTNITERKEAEELLKASERKWFSLVNNMPDFISILDSDNCFLYLNHYSEGFSEKDVVGESVFNFFQLESREMFLNAIVECRKTKNIQSLSHMAMGANGSMREYEDSITYLPNSEGDLNVMVVSRDITERKKTEEALRETENRFRAIFEQAAMGVALLNSKTGQYIRINKKYCDILGYTKDEMLGKTFIDITYSQDIQENVDRISQLIEEDGNEYSFEKRYVRKDGTIIRANLTISPLWKTGEKPKDHFHIAIVEDITERKLAEDKIKSLLTEKELILKEVHHRIKNNMNTISSLLSLQAQNLTEPLAINALEDAKSRVLSMEILYGKLYQAVDFSNVFVKDYLSTLVAEIMANFPLKPLVKLETHIDRFVLDANRLQTVGIIINELLTNIMKYAFKGKRGGLVIVSATKLDGHISISIQDDGNGMPESISFDNSTGFGLFLVKLLTQQLNGIIRIKRGNGTKVVLEFEM